MYKSIAAAALSALLIAAAPADAKTFKGKTNQGRTASLVTGDLEALPLAALVSTGACVSLGVVAAATGSLDFGFEAEGWLWLALAALVSTVGAVVLFFSGMSRVGPSTAAILSTLEPPVTVSLVFVTFGDALGAVQILGALAVLGAAVIVNLPARRAAVAVSA